MIPKIDNSMLKPEDPILWARQPSSQMALEFILELANKEEDPRFIEILQMLRDKGVVDGDTLVTRYDQRARQWVPV